MNRKQLTITGGIIVLGLLLAFPLTWMFSEPGTPGRQALVLPAGSYAPIHRTDGNEVDWAINPVGGRPAAGDPNGAQAKPVIVVKTDVFRASGRDVLIGLILQDRDGQRYQPVVVKGGARQPAPTLRVVNEAGQVILDDSFRYG